MNAPVDTLLSLPTPRIYIDQDRVRRNIADMAALASRAGVRLRPHAKTHKSPVIARWQLDAGAVGICCAKLGEAEVFADAGIPDIRLPYPVNPANADRVVRLMDRTTLSIIVDDEDVARGWSKAMTEAGRTLDVLVKIDVGFHRCGLDPSRLGVVETIRTIASLPGLNFRGLLSHAGHSYLAGSEEEIAYIAETEIGILNALAASLRASGVTVDEISVGSTPSARFITKQAGVTEMRPGNYVFCDRTQVGLGSATFDTCAMWVVATVVSRPARDRVILDCGAKTLTNDGARGFGPREGYGLVFSTLASTAPDPTLTIERLSEEHATVAVRGDCALKTGDRVKVLPNHSCVVTNLVDDLLVIDGAGGLDVVDRIPVAARGRIW
jgi:D-serine deaminase-like pyridoxal phosphate-dependent protein